ncbi:MAG: T9SS C-terminal target domain-containing protein [Bacteroidetes bacterium]|nr:MAG: T9SS C-terminal target domain-containing protein [Bacteroidota bacterium]
MQSILRLVVFALFVPCSILAQSNYSQTNFRAGQSTYTDIGATGTAIAMTDAAAGTSTVPQNIGFNFNFNGTVFTQFMMHADGIMRFGTSAPGAATDIAASNAGVYGAVFTATSANLQNIVLPFFTNLVAGVGSPEFHVLTTGTAPGRVCTIQWKNLRDADDPGGSTQHQFSNLSFQVKLYESSNDIEFVYGTFMPSANATLGRGAASGIKATSTSFLGLYRVNSFMPYQKTIVVNPTHHARIASSFPFRKTVLPAFGYSSKFFGRLNADVNVAKIYADSIVPVGNQTAGRVEALVVNEGSTTMNNIAVNLSITGANTHADAVNIASLAAGASQRIVFPDYSLSNKGQQNIQVAVALAGDDRAENNQLAATQVLSQSHYQTRDFSTTSNLGIGFTSSQNLTSIKMYGSGTRKLLQLRLPFGSYRSAVNIRIYEDGGAGGGPSGAALFTTSTFFTTNEQSIIVPLGAGVTVTGDYFIAVQQTTTTNMAWRILMNPPIRNNRYFNSSTNGTNWATDATDPPWELMVEDYSESTGRDIGIENLTQLSCNYSTSTPITVRLRNFSANAIDFSVNPTTITGKMTNPAGTDFPFTIPKNSGLLAPGAVEELTVLNSYDFSSRGIHRISAKTNLADDTEAGNDSLAFIINNSIPILAGVANPVCPLTSITLTGPANLASLQWNVDGAISAGTTRTLAPVKTTIVRISGTDYRNCVLQDSIIIVVKGDGLPPKPILLLGDTLLSHRRAFTDTVRVQKLAGHTIQWLGGLGTVASDSALILNQIAGMQNAKIAAAYTRTVDGCSNISDTINYNYAPGVLHNSSEALTVCDTAYYDFGGPVSNTGGNFTRTFMPATPGKKMRLTIYKLELASFASLQIFDGPSTAAPRIEALSNAQNGNTTRTFISSHESGILTVRFAIGSSASSGWWAGLTCHTPEVFRTVEPGNWISPATWESKLPGGSYLPALRPPSKGDDTVYIRHNVGLTASTPMDQIVVEESGTLGIENPAVNFISMPAYKTVPQPEFLVKGTLNISPRVQIFGSEGQMIIQGRLNNFGQIDFDSVVFNGTTPQILGDFSGASGTLKRLHINNPAGLTLGSDQSVSGFRFVRGLITTNSENMLTLTDNANDENAGHPNAYVNGPLTVEISSGSGNRLFPIGKNGAYRPILLSNDNGGDNSDRFTAEIVAGPPPNRTLPAGVSAVSTVRHYRVTRNGNNGSDFRITLPYGTDDGVTDPADLTILKDNGAGAWLNIGGTPTGAAPGSIESNTFNGFSDFVLATKTGSLPVTWLSFTARRQQNKALLEWRTAQEQNCSQYEVERSSDGIQYRTISRLTCRNQQLPQSYTYTDVAPGTGLFYYRIKQVDADGKFTFSSVRTASFETEAVLQVYPNPAKNTMLITGLQPHSSINLFDATGRNVLQTRAAQSMLQLQVGHLPAGIYQLTITQTSGVQNSYRMQIVK